MKLSIEHIRNIFLEKEIKATLPRIYIFQELTGNYSHPSAEELFNKVSRRHPGISLATIYKTLEILVEKQLVRKVVTDEDKIRYDHRTEPHIHLYCDTSKTIHDFEDADLENLIQNHLARKKIPGFKVSSIQVNIMGNFQKTQKINK